MVSIRRASSVGAVDAVAAGVGWATASAAVAFTAGRSFRDAVAVPSRTPDLVGLPYQDVAYGPDRCARWIEAGPVAPAIVLVHGYDARRGTELRRRSPRDS